MRELLTCKECRQRQTENWHCGRKAKWHKTKKRVLRMWWKYDRLTDFCWAANICKPSWQTNWTIPAKRQKNVNQVCNQRHEAKLQKTNVAWIGESSSAGSTIIEGTAARPVWINTSWIARRNSEIYWEYHWKSCSISSENTTVLLVV